MNTETFHRLWSPHPDAPAQNWEELFWLVNKVESIKPKTILEIGVARGGSLRYWEHLVPKGELVIGIDADKTVMSQMSEWWDWRNSDRQLRIIIGKSLQPKVVKCVKEYVGERQIDFLFIDGDHDPWSIFQEFVIYGEMVRYGGIIAFHDIRPEEHLQYVFDKIRGRTERYFIHLGIGIYWKEKLPQPDLSLIALVRDLPPNHPDRAVLFDLDNYQANRLREVWKNIKFDGWKE